MLARIGDVEARLHAGQKQAQDAEARAGELAAQLDKHRAEHEAARREADAAVDGRGEDAGGADPGEG